MQLRDISGERFGRLTAVSPSAGGLNRKMLWYCECDCGGETFVELSNLRTGHTTSCGCGSSRYNQTYNDLTGRVFGRLLVLGVASRAKLKWLCRCSCGRETSVLASRLKNGTTSSCGCLHAELLSSAMSERMTTHGLSRTSEYRAEMRSIRRVRMMAGDPPKISVKRITSIMRSMKARCFYCGGEYEQIDHFIPLSRGGLHATNNLVPACARCNLTKHNKLVGSEWIPPIVYGWT